LIWQESSFRASVVSPAGAQGLAQFMPKTAGERGLADPFDPEQAIPEAASLLRDLQQRFGNLGLAAAAYNAGPTRVTNWIAGGGDLPAETRAYVQKITGRSVDAWAADGKSATIADEGGDQKQSCLQVAITIRRVEPGPDVELAPFAPWGIQLAGSFSKAAALTQFARARRSYSTILGDVKPLIIGTRLLSRGRRPFYRVRVGEPDRRSADRVCDKITHIGGACVVLAN
ncbi:MAG TPA: lytic transglycosylase domain-containing protein, partial [Beijerinckiaceae bacterium]|nr:lytic transglycosylase domain-containing protein [Beijerinckiaceae bacterium]